VYLEPVNHPGNLPLNMDGKGGKKGGGMTRAKFSLITYIRQLSSLDNIRICQSRTLCDMFPENRQYTVLEF
jgi:hypothetical protein